MFKAAASCEITFSAQHVCRTGYLTILGLCIAVFLVPVTVATPGTLRPCGDIPGRLIYGIKAQRVTCATSRRIARQWAIQCAQLRTGSCLVTALYYCRYRKSGYESGRTRCVHDYDLRKPMPAQRVVLFQTGS